MSKKIYSKTKWKRYVRLRQFAQLRAARRVEEARRSTPIIPISGRRKRKKDIRPRQTILAPRVLSLIDNPEGTIAFLDEIEFTARSSHLSLDLNRVSTLTTDAIAVLLATIRKDNIHGSTNIHGNFPNDPVAQERLVESGFFSFISTARSIPRAPKGRMAERQSKKVEPKTARDLIHTATKAIYGQERRSPPAYRVLIESMGNTHNHAAGQRHFRETWWATVYADIERGRLCYTFVDTGVGIFKSVKFDKLRSLYKMVGFKSNADLLLDILHGKVKSSTGYDYRGKGLPAIYQQFGHGGLKDLVIVANDVYANIGRNEYRTLPRPFSGTVIYWEV